MGVGMCSIVYAGFFYGWGSIPGEAQTHGVRWPGTGRGWGVSWDGCGPAKGRGASGRDVAGAWGTSVWWGWWWGTSVWWEGVVGGRGGEEELRWDLGWPRG